jgi:hypothetical protein
MPWYIVQVKASGIIGETTNIDSLLKAFEWTKERFQSQEIANSPLCYACLSSEPWWGEYVPGEIPNDHSFLINSLQLQELQAIIRLKWRIPESTSLETEMEANAVLQEYLKDANHTFELGLQGD